MVVISKLLVLIVFSVTTLLISFFISRKKEAFANSFFYENPKNIRQSEYSKFACETKSCKSEHADFIGIIDRPSYHGFDNFYI